MDRRAEFLIKAEALRPVLFENQKKPQQAITVSRDVNNFAIVNPTGEYHDKTLGPGESICLDFGDHYVGHLYFDFGYEGKHPDAPAWLKIQFAERAEELFEDIDTYNGWISKGWIQQEEIHIDILPARLSLPRRYAFRYVKITVLDVSSRYRLALRDCHCTEYTSAEDDRFQVSPQQDPMLVEIDRIAARTLRNCMQDIFEDGPKRDRRLWLGDLRLQALANYATYRNNDLVKRCLYLFAGTTSEEGMISSCLFTRPEVVADDNYMFDYALLFIPTLLDYWKETDDRETLIDLYPIAKRQLELANRQFDETGVIRDSDVLGWCFVDWNLDLNKQASAQAIYLYCLKAMRELATALDDCETVTILDADFIKKQKASMSAFWDSSQKVFTSGTDKQISFASQIWMVLAGVIEGDAARDLLRRIETFPDAVHIVTPYLYHHYISALLLLNMKDEALDEMKYYWGGMIAKGADTFWELFDPENPDASPYGGTIVNSYCHAWSCTPAYLIRKHLKDLL